MTIKVTVKGPFSRESMIELNDLNELLDMEYVLGVKVTYDECLNRWTMETNTVQE